MDKTAILAELNRTGEINIFRATENWRRAFELYNKTHGGHKNPNCGSCFREVKAWLVS